MKRIYERTEVSEAAFSELLHEHLWEFIKGVSIAEAAGLWVQGDNFLSRATAVPYANGLMIVTSRMLVGNTDDGEFGFKGSLPSGKMTKPFISRTRHIESIEGGAYLPPHAQIGVLTCGITYLDLGSLRGEQEDYFYTFEALETALGSEHVGAAVHCSIAPQLSHQQPLGVRFPETATRHIERARSLLSTWLEAREDDPLCGCLPYEE